MLLNDDLGKKDNNPLKLINSLSKSNPYKMYYDFYEDAWIGYLPSSVLHKNEDKNSTIKNQVSDDLTNQLSHALKIFKDKGVEQIETDVKLDDDKLHSALTNHNFEYVDSERLVSRLTLNNVKLSDKFKDTDYLNSQLESHGFQSKPSFLKSNVESGVEEEVISFLTDNENISKESLRSFFIYLKKNPDKIISQITVMDNNKINGYTMIVKTRWDSNTGILSFLDIVNTVSPIVKDLILAKSINDCKNNGIELLEVHIRDDVLEKENTYLKYGFEFKNVHRFQLID